MRAVKAAVTKARTAKSAGNALEAEALAKVETAPVTARPRGVPAASLACAFQRPPAAAVNAAR